ncbi:hypothetical protein GGH12_006305, partial [Coemansia sp. RSA 1822]
MDGIHDSEATGDITEMTERRHERAEPVADAGRRPTARNAMLVGGLSLLVCIFSFVGQTTATRRVQESYQQPYLILWISHSFWIITLPLHTLYEKLKRRPRSLGALRAETLVASAKLIVQRKRVRAETATSEYRPIQTADPDATMQLQASGTALGSDGTRVRTAFKDDDEEGGADTPDPDTEADVNDASDADGARALARRRPWWIMGRMALLAALLVGLLNASAYLWYVAVALTSMSK